MENTAYGILTLWNQGGWVIKGTALVLLGMSVVSWTTIAFCTWRAWKLYSLSKQVAVFGKTPSFSLSLMAPKTGPDDNPFYALACEGASAVRQYADRSGRLCERTSLSDWLTEKLRGPIDDSAATLQRGLAVLASIGATAPFIGLFGTVWGIYHALVSIGLSGQASIDKIAGPVGESLIMTALGLAVAIPAVLGYNAFTRFNRRFIGELNRFARRLYSDFMAKPEIAVSSPGQEEN